MAASGLPSPKPSASSTPVPAKDRSKEIEALQRTASRYADPSDRARQAERLSTLVAAQRARSEWLAAHPEVVAYVVDLGRQVKEGERRRAYGVARGADHASLAHDPGPNL